MQANTSRFKDKVVFITGGTSGIGLATAVQFAKEGAAHIIVVGRRQEKWTAANKYLNEKLTADQIGRIEYWPCDVRVESQVKEAIEKVFTKYGRLDVCFNNAGVQPGVVSGKDSGFITSMVFDSAVGEDGSIIYRVPPPQPTSNASAANRPIPPTQETPASEYCESEIATSCLGVFYSVKWEVAYIFEKQPKDLPAAIINTASRNGVLPDAHRPLYAAAKAFILSLTKSVANQVAQKCNAEQRAMLRVNAISPGPIDTPLEFAAFGDFPSKTDKYGAYVKAATVGVPMHRTGQAEEIAPTVLFLADPNTASYITATNVAVDGGHTGCPLLCACD